MTKHKASAGSASPFPQSKLSLLPLVICAVALTLMIPLARWMDARQTAAAKSNPETVAEEMYLAGERVRKIVPDSLRGLVADWYWMRTLQYVGKKSLANPSAFSLDDMSALNLKLLPGLLDTTVALDPQFIPSYEYGAMILPAINKDEAVRFLEDGIAENPGVWRLYHHLGYIHWQSGAYAEASRAYSDGARLPDAPKWMRGMTAKIEADGGNRTLAREMYERIYVESDDKIIKEMAAKRLIWLQSNDERDAIRRVIETVKTRDGNCPDDWRDMSAELRVAGLRLDTNGAPLDPLGKPYVFKLAKCEVELNPMSEVIRS